uniref:Uncharacterized protein n=1 Tax=Pseudomonas syringae TaxID=317 RepID=I3W2P3_PSESX|nr:hypothetical protein [Pseudomonas syringae]
MASSQPAPLQSFHSLALPTSLLRASPETPKPIFVRLLW